MNALDGPQKTHRPSRSKKKKSKSSNSSKKHAVAKPGAFARRLKLSADRSQRRAQNPTTPLSRPHSDTAPRVVAVVGPKGTGKSTIIRNLVRHYTKRNVPNITGPITVVTGRKKRVTFVEVGGDLPSMIDVAKVADLVLLVIDAAFGFEMETFEFLNILAAHGMPKVIGVLTHLDNIREGKQVRKTKKSLKDRIWAELYDGAKVFYLSGITTTGDYLKREVLNLARFISVAKFPTLRWRAEHPYVLADRVEDITPKSIDHNANRTVAAYGYIRGNAVRPTAGGWRVHLAGVGDLVAENLEIIPDPCPMPEEDGDGMKKKRKIGERERVIYAPMAPEVDGIAYDRDAVYIELQKEDVRFSDKKDVVGDLPVDEEPDGEGEIMVKSLQKGEGDAVDEELKKVELQLVKGGKNIVSEEFSHRNGRRKFTFGHGDGSEDSESEDSESSEDSGSEDESDADNTSEPKEITHDADDSERDSGESSDESDEEVVAAKRWKTMMLENADKNLKTHISPSKVLSKYIYKKDENGEYIGGRETKESKEDEEDSDGDTFFKVKGHGGADAADPERKNMFSEAVLDDITRLLPQATRNWMENDELCAVLKQGRFGTGRSISGKGEQHQLESDEASEVDGDFEDLETGEVHRAGGKEVDSENDPDSDDEDMSDVENEDETQQRRRGRRRFTDFSDEESSDEEGGVGKSSRKPRHPDDEIFRDERRLERERLEKIKAEELDGLDEEARIALEGVRPGLYVRLELQDVPVEFVKYFDPDNPVVIGGLKPSDDEGKTYLRARVRRHRFKRGVLKSADPVVLSIGWRRFQSVPIYDTEDQGGRYRYLKYTPEYLHCNATFWAPGVAPGAGVIMCQSFGRSKRGFRIAGSGVVTEVGSSFNVVKKLKLIGEPLKVHRNTAFIKGMFNSELEASKYLGASLRTVSGIRGTVKKTISIAQQRGSTDRDIAKAPPGTFRAGFEDKILLSDIVFLRAWVPVEAPKFFSMASTLLDKKTGSNVETWRMRTVREIREAKQLSIPLNKDSLYTPIERTAPKFAPLKISKKLEGALPYASKPKQFSAKGLKKPRTERKAAVAEERAVVLNPEEKAQRKLLQAVYTIRNDRLKRRKAANKVRLEKRQKEIAKAAEKHEKTRSERRKRKFALQGAQEMRQSKRQRGGGEDD